MSFTITIPNIPLYWRHIIYSLIIACFIIFSYVKRIKTTTVITILLLTFIIYMLFNLETGTNLEGSMSSTTYPPPPHLGLDGVSLENSVMI